MLDGTDSFRPEQNTKTNEQENRVSDKTGDLKVPANALSLPGDDTLTKQGFPRITADGSPISTYPVKPLGSLTAPPKSLPDTDVGRTRSTEMPARIGDVSAPQPKQKPKLTQSEIDKDIVNLGSTKHDLATDAILTLGESLAATNGARVLTALGKALDNKDPAISKTAAELLSHTYLGSLPRDPSTDSSRESVSLRYSDGALPSNENLKSSIFAYLSNPQNLEGELKKIAELRRIMGDESKFQKIKDNAAGNWPAKPVADSFSPRTDRMDAIFQLNKVRDLLLSMRANSSDEFLTKNLHLLQNQSILDLKTFPATISTLKEIAKQMPNVEALYISNGAALNDEGLKTIQELKQLRTLRIEGSNLTDQGLAMLGKMQRIQHLHLGHTPHLTNQGIANLIGSKLSTISIDDNPQITDEAIPSLRQMANGAGWLNINLHNTGITVYAMQTARFDFNRTRIFVSGGTPGSYWDSQEQTPENMRLRFPEIFRE